MKLGIAAAERVVLAMAFVMFGPPTVGFAQNCATVAECNVVRQAAEIVQPRAGIGLSGGNPVSGASSTLGMRIGSVPRITIAARATGVRLSAPTVNDEIKQLVTSFNLDAAIGVFSGLRVVPTIGGLGSLDAVASVGTLRLPGDQGFDNSVSSWALGARVGILRESFTAPGISITAMYRRLGDVEWHLPARGGDPFHSASFEMTDNSVLSVRGVIGKRLFVLGSSAGIGVDKYSSDIRGSYTCVTCPATSSFDVEDHATTRTTLFANVSWTMLILNLVAEGGWQSGGERFSGPLPQGDTNRSDQSSYYGSLAIRLAL